MEDTVSTPFGQSIDFNSLHEQAMGFGNDTPSAPEQTPPATPAVETPAPEGITSTPNEPIEVENKTAAQLAQIADDQLVEVIVDGQPVQMPWKDAKAGFSRHADYTRKAQALARERQELEAQRGPLSEAAQQRDAFIQLFDNKELLRKVLEAKHPDLIGQPAKDAAAAIAANAPSMDPEEIATVGQVQQFLQNAQQTIKQEIESARAALRKEIETATRGVEDNLETAKLSTQINGTVAEIFKADPLIEKLIPNANELLRWNVQQLNPQTPEETLAAFRQVAAGWSESIKEQIAAHNKTLVINKQQLVDNNIQAPGGSPVVPTPTSFNDPKTGKLDWSKVTAAAMAYEGKK
jgi:hypothetical protein